jgi:histidinol-phosphatase (PHP family)
LKRFSPGKGVKGKLKMIELAQIQTDYHIHSTFSPDGNDAPEVLCQRALDLGLEAIAITEHAEWHPDYENEGFPSVDTYFEAMDRCRAKFEPRGLTVLTGVELGNPHHYVAEATELVASYPFDVVQAALHWLDGHNIHLEPCFAGRTADEVYAAYFLEMERMAANFEFDFVAHFDRIIWRGVQLGLSLNPHRLEPVIRNTLASLVRYDHGLELNTRFLNRQPNWNEAIVTILRWFRLEGGRRVFVNSDAHQAHFIGRNREIAARLLAEAGFEGAARLLPASLDNEIELQNHWLRIVD